MIQGSISPLLHAQEMTAFANLQRFNFSCRYAIDLSQMRKCLHPSTKELVKCTCWDNSGSLPLALYVSENLIGLLHRPQYMMSLLRQISGILFYSY